MNALGWKEVGRCCLVDEQAMTGLGLVAMYMKYVL